MYVGVADVTTFTKFTHTLFKHHQASRRPSMKCAKREKRELSDYLFEEFSSYTANFSFVVVSVWLRHIVTVVCW